MGADPPTHLQDNAGALSLSHLSHTALTSPCPLSRGVEPRRVSLALRRCAPGSSRARPPPHMADKICRASMGSVSVQTAGWRSCVEPHSHALASHICGTRWSSWGVFFASGYFSWACSLSVDHLSFCPLPAHSAPLWNLLMLFWLFFRPLCSIDESSTNSVGYTSDCGMGVYVCVLSPLLSSGFLEQAYRYQTPFSMVPPLREPRTQRWAS